MNIYSMPKIIIIDDEAMITKMYEQKCVQAGYTAFCAFNGRDGLALIARESPDLVLLDILMPRMDGLAVLEALRRAPATKALPVLLLTNLGHDDDIRHCEQLGISGYCVKSKYTPEQILEKVQAILGSL